MIYGNDKTITKLFNDEKSAIKWRKSMEKELGYHEHHGTERSL